MRLGKDVLGADLYGELGLLPDATESEVRVAYRQHVRASHPDLNRDDPDAVRRMTRLNIAAKVLLDPSLRRAYDRAARSAGEPPTTAKAPTHAAWFERRERMGDDDWSPAPSPQRERSSSFGPFFSELRRADGRLTLQVQELVESLSARQQLGVAALLFAIALGLIVMAQPRGVFDDSLAPTSVDVGSVYP